MQLIRGIYNIQSKHRNMVLTIGNFDGLHSGHQRILSALTEQAALLDAPSCVMLFEPQPKEKLIANKKPARIYNFREKLQILATLGIDFVLCQPFTEHFRQLSAEEFICDVLIKKLEIQHLIIGDDFQFGCDRKGNFNLLHHFSNKFGFTIQQSSTICCETERVSSSKIRQLLKEANFSAANKLLGRPFRLSGRVIKGNELGQTIGVPTANLHIKRHELPINGVFAVRVYGLDKPYFAVANAGIKPTVSGTGPSFEVHILNFEGNLYGKLLTVELLEKIRDEKRFSSLPVLKQAIEQDILTVKQRFAV
ncbi:MAG: bifunctional riboflavin kinase/FAD synthetase [Endozoicomonadaceae bacterium]|nr:bifunctional riboflavin kinase/FAD synthetase [Endozoicomonadaceae bacterium]